MRSRCAYLDPSDPCRNTPVKYALLIWAGFWKRPARTVLTVLSIAVAFVLFGSIQGISSAFGAVQERLRADRLVTNNPSLLPLPIADQNKIRAVPGVVDVTQVAMMFATYQEPRNTVVPMATDVRTMFATHPEWHVSAEGLAAMKSHRTGAIVGSGHARRFGWKIGDRIPLMSRTLKTDGSTDWAFDVVAIYDDENSPGEANGFFINYDYFDAARYLDRGTVVQYLTVIDKASDAILVSSAIDRIFENSSSPTRTQSEKESVQSRLAQVGSIELFVSIILSAVFFALLFLTANTMAQSVRERLAEFATLKTIGFSDVLIVELVLAESALLFLTGAILGLSAAGIILSRIQIPLLVPQISSSVLAAAGLVCALMVAISTVVPAWRARQLNIVDALRRT